MNINNIIDDANTKNIKRKPYYIYDLEQINWMLEQNCMPLEVGRGAKGEVYLIFPRTFEMESIVHKWKLKKWRLAKSLNN